MKTAILLAAMLVMTAGAQARPRHEVPVPTAHKYPRFFKDRKWWLGEAIMTTAVILDADSTNRVMRACPICIEKSFLLPARPTSGQVYGTLLAQLAAYTGVNILAHYEATPSQTWHPNRVFSFVLNAGTPAIVGTGHLVSAIQNYRIASDCEAAKLVCR